VKQSFGGFSTQRDQSIPLPIELFTEVMAQVRELAELKLLLTVFRLLAAKEIPQGKPRAVSWQELRQDEDLRQGLMVVGQELSPEERLNRALEQAVGRGTLLHLVVQKGGHTESWYLVNTAMNRRLLAELEEGPAEMLKDTPFEAGEIQVKRPTIFALYEQNIGMITPMLADQLAEADDLYPADWIEDAFRIAVANNVRRWSYIQAILDRWQREGRGERPSREPGEIDLEDYKRGEYADIFGEDN
jgi:DnaD/phage-associated family protein